MPAGGARAGVEREDIFRGLDASGHIVRVADEVPMHIHERHDEIVVVQKGAGRLTYGRGFGKLASLDEVDLFAGDVIFVPRGVMHAFRNNLAPHHATAVLSFFAPPFDGVDRVGVEPAGRK